VLLATAGVPAERARPGQARHGAQARHRDPGGRHLPGGPARAGAAGGVGGGRCDRARHPHAHREVPGGGGRRNILGQRARPTTAPSRAPCTRCRRCSRWAPHRRAPLSGDIPADRRRQPAGHSPGYGGGRGRRRSSYTLILNRGCCWGPPRSAERAGLDERGDPGYPGRAPAGHPGRYGARLPHLGEALEPAIAELVSKVS